MQLFTGYQLPPHNIRGNVIDYICLSVCFTVTTSSKKIKKKKKSVHNHKVIAESTLKDR